MANPVIGTTFVLNIDPTLKTLKELERATSSTTDKVSKTAIKMAQMQTKALQELAKGVDDPARVERLMKRINTAQGHIKKAGNDMVKDIKSVQQASFSSMERQIDNIIRKSAEMYKRTGNATGSMSYATARIGSLDSVKRYNDSLKQVENQSKVTADKVSNNMNGIKFDPLKANLYDIRNDLIGLMSIGTAVQTMDVGIKLESVRASYRAMTGSVEDAGRAFEFVNRTSKETGVNILEGAKDFRMLVGASEGAGYTMEQLEKTYRASASASAILGLTTEDTTGIMRAFGQIMSKGTVQAEELKGQLGDRLPGAVGLAAKAMGVTNRELLKLMENGELMSSEFIPKFTDALQKMYGDDKLKDAQGTLLFGIKQLKNDIIRFQDSIINNTGVGEVLIELAKSMQNVFIEGQKLTNLDLGFNLKENAKEIVKVIEEVAELIAIFMALKLGIKVMDSLKASFISFQTTAKASTITTGVFATKLQSLGVSANTTKVSMYALSTAVTKVKAILSTFMPLAALTALTEFIILMDSTSETLENLEKQFKETALTLNTDKIKDRLKDLRADLDGTSGFFNQFILKMKQAASFINTDNFWIGDSKDWNKPKDAIKTEIKVLESQKKVTNAKEVAEAEAEVKRSSKGAKEAFKDGLSESEYNQLKSTYYMALKRVNQDVEDRLKTETDPKRKKQIKDNYNSQLAEYNKFLKNEKAITDKYFKNQRDAETKFKNEKKAKEDTTKNKKDTTIADRIRDEKIALDISKEQIILQEKLSKAGDDDVAKSKAELEFESAKLGIMSYYGDKQVDINKQVAETLKANTNLEQAQIEAKEKADKEAVERWDNYAELKSKQTWGQLENEIKSEEDLEKAQQDRINKKYNALDYEADMRNKINSFIDDEYTRETLAENNRFIQAKNELDRKLELKEITQETYNKAIEDQKTLNKLSKDKIELSKKDNNEMNKTFKDIGNQLGSTMAQSLVNSLQNGTSIQQGFAQAGISMGGNALAMGMATGNPTMMGAGLAIGAVGALLEKPQETLISQENYLSELTASNKAILEETKAFRILNKIFGTDYKADKSSFLTQYKQGYTLNTNIGDGMQNYIESLFSDIENATMKYTIKVGEQTIQKTKSGFLGIGASSSTEIRDIWKDFTGTEVAALQFLSQFGVDSEGKLTSEGLQGVTSAFNSWNDLMTTLDDYSANITDIEKITKELSRIDTQSIKDEMYQMYSNELSAVGINIAELTVDNIGEAFSDTTLGDLIRNNPSLNVEALTGYVNELNNAYLKQIELTKELNDLRKKETLAQMDLAKELKDYEEQLKDLNSTISVNFKGVFDPLLNALKSIKEMASDTVDSMDSQDVERFWELDAQYKKLMSENKFEEAQSVFSKISSLSTSLYGENDKFKAGITDYMNNIIVPEIEAKDNIIKVEIAGGLGELLGLTSEQIKQLKTISNDGEVSKEELKSITGLSSEQVTNLTELLKETGLLSTENTLFDLNEYARLQLEEIRKANTMETSSLSATSFQYLDYLGKKEQYDIASTLGKSFQDVEDFIYQLQSFDIKDSIQDLEEMKSLIGYTFNTETGLISYDQNAVTDLSKLWDVLPQDVKDAYGALNSLAVSEQSGFKSGKESLVNTTLASNVSKERQDLLVAQEDIYRITSSVSKLGKNDFVGGGELASVKNRIATSLGVDVSLVSFVPMGGGWSNAFKLDKTQTLNNITNSINLPTQQSEYNTALQTYLDELAKLQSYQVSQLPSFSVGASSVPYDMVAQIHSKEMIVPATFAESIRQGQMTLSGGSNSFDNGIIRQELRYLNEKLGKVIAIQDSQLTTQRQTLGVLAEA